jgi:RNA polymerase sigma-70 factor, ECF subfamily
VISDPEAFEALYRDTRADLLAYLLRRSPNAEDAADALSETYLIAWRKLEDVPAGAAARLWLFGVARNVLRRGADRERSRDALVQRLAGELRELVSVPTADLDDLPTRALKAGLASLGECDREIVTLTAWEDLTPREIAAVLGRPTSIVRARLHRARARLRARLREIQPVAPKQPTVAVGHELKR